MCQLYVMTPHHSGPFHHCLVCTDMYFEFWVTQLGQSNGLDYFPLYVRVCVCLSVCVCMSVCVCVCVCVCGVCV